MQRIELLWSVSGTHTLIFFMGQTPDARQTDKMDCLTPPPMCGEIFLFHHHDYTHFTSPCHYGPVSGRLQPKLDKSAATDNSMNKSDVSCLKNQLGTTQVKCPRLNSATGEVKLATVA